MITSLPRPSRQDVQFAPRTKDWHWQPVGMDISADNLAAVILTYRAVYYFTRQPGQDWFDALNQRGRDALASATSGTLRPSRSQMTSAALS